MKAIFLFIIGLSYFLPLSILADSDCKNVFAPEEMAKGRIRRLQQLRRCFLGFTGATFQIKKIKQ